MPLPKVWISGRVEPGPLKLLEGKAEVEMRDDTSVCPREEYMDKVRGVDYIVACMHFPPFDQEVAQATEGRLRGYASRSVGIGQIDLALATRYGVPCTNTPGVLVDAVAAHTVGLIIAGARLYHQGIQMAQAGEWLHAQSTLVGQSIYGRTLAIVGLGPIGARVARTMRLGFGMRVVYWSRTRKPELEAELGLEYMPLYAALALADIVSVNCALAPETRHIIDARALEVMKPTTVIVNVSRGKLIDQEALLCAVNEGRIFAAAVDVTDPEPLATDHPFLHHPRIFFQPHIGGGEIETREGMTRLAVENVLDMIEGRRPRSLLNLAVYERADR
ncbi:MAG: NAD(P)-dependent oxidoreductase [bacterium]|nr:NAD(P)-dependent oxidoreductase [bacterium]